MNERRNALAAALISVGVLWLLIVVGFVPPAIVNALWRLWPLLLIGVGLDLWLPHRRPWHVPFTALAAAIVLLVAIVSPGALRRSPATKSFQEPLGPATQATLDLRLPSSAAVIGPTMQPDDLLEVSTVGKPEARVDVSGTAHKTVTVIPIPSFPTLGRSSWTIGLSDRVPLALSVRGGSGSARLALGALRLTSLTLDLGSGSSTTLLPDNGNGYTVRLDGGSGSTRLNVPTGASVDMKASTHSGSTHIDIDPGSDVRLTLSTRSGSVVVDVPDDAPVLLEVQDDGSGSLTVAPFLRRSSGSGETGVWRTTNYSDGGRTVRITIQRAGSGSIQIR